MTINHAHYILLRPACELNQMHIICEYLWATTKINIKKLLKYKRLATEKYELSCTFFSIKAKENEKGLMNKRKFQRTVN